jgi:exonuclease III
LEQLRGHPDEVKTPIALCGDFPTRTPRGLNRLLEQGWTDTLHHLYPAARIYIFWITFANIGRGTRGYELTIFC